MLLGMTHATLSLEMCLGVEQKFCPTFRSFQLAKEQPRPTFIGPPHVQTTPFVRKSLLCIQDSTRDCH